MSAVQEPTQKNQGFFGNLAFNIVIPVVLMSYASSEDYLGCVEHCGGTQLSYWLWPMGFKRVGKGQRLFHFRHYQRTTYRRVCLLKLPAEYIAIKEAAIPGIIGIAVR